MRKDYISWQQYFMGIALLSAKRSKDPSTQVGACIVGRNNKILSMGYNGFPNGVEDHEFPWNRDGKFLENKYAYVCHAELNAILNSTTNLEGSSLYVTLFPCNECTKAIIQSGITSLYYLSDKFHDLDATKASRRMLDAASISYTKLDFEDMTLTQIDK